MPNEAKFNFVFHCSLLSIQGLLWPHSGCALAGETGGTEMGATGSSQGEARPCLAGSAAEGQVSQSADVIQPHGEDSGLASFS